MPMAKKSSKSKSKTKKPKRKIVRKAARKSFGRRKAAGGPHGSGGGRND
jgi:hypothetical protein